MLAGGIYVHFPVRRPRAFSWGRPLAHHATPTATGKATFDVVTVVGYKDAYHTEKTADRQEDATSDGKTFRPVLYAQMCSTACGTAATRLLAFHCRIKVFIL